MKTLILILLPIMAYCQTYIGINGGNTDLEQNLAFTASVNHHIEKIGARAYYHLSHSSFADNYESFGLQATFRPLTDSFYRPVLQIGGEISEGDTRPSFGISNQLFLEDNIAFTLGLDMTLLAENWVPYYSIGIAVEVLPVPKDFKPRFF